MNSRQWLACYQANRTNRPEPKWDSPSPMDPPIQRLLARSLSHFQLGETGEGALLISAARAQAPDDPVYHDALELFIAEEGEHARLLERLLLRFGGTTSIVTGRMPCFGGSRRRLASGLKFKCCCSN